MSSRRTPDSLRDAVPGALAVVLGGVAAVMSLLAVAANPVFGLFAVVFGAAAGFVYYHASGRLAARVYRSVHAQGQGTRTATDDRGQQWVSPGDASRRVGFDGGRWARRVGFGGEASDRRSNDRRGQRRATDAGPREAWRPPRDGRRARAAAGNQRRRTRGGQSHRGPSGRVDKDRPTDEADRPTATDYRTLGLDPGASTEAIEQAYRERVKEVHPDVDGGDADAFQDVQAAYERLTR